jgi:hypothetical protein
MFHILQVIEGKFNSNLIFNNLMNNYDYNFSILNQFFSYSGCLLDITVIFGLLSNNYYIHRLYIGLIICFHLCNHFLFVIETFPWVMISSCILFGDNIINKYNDNQFDKKEIIINNTNNSIWKSYKLLIGIIFILIQILIPLPCALSTMFTHWPNCIASPTNHDKNYDISYYSNCQFFSWRMMTRQIRVLSTDLRLQSPLTNRVDVIPISLPFSQASSSLELLNNFEYNPFYEDRLLKIIKDIKLSAVSTEDNKDQVSSAPYIYVDLWLQVNGPPIQRYINPVIDIGSSKEIDKWNIPCSSLSSCFQLYNNSPKTMLPWVRGRIVKYRTQIWINKMDKLEEKERNNMRYKYNNCKINESCNINDIYTTHPLVLFITDISCDNNKNNDNNIDEINKKYWNSFIIDDEFTSMELIDGSIDYLNHNNIIQTISAINKDENNENDQLNNNIKFVNYKGIFKWKVSYNSTNSNASALLMITLLNGIDNFSMKTFLY